MEKIKIGTWVLWQNQPGTVVEVLSQTMIVVSLAGLKKKFYWSKKDQSFINAGHNLHIIQ